MKVIILSGKRKGLCMEITGDLVNRIRTGVTRAIVRDKNMDMIAWENTDNMREATPMEMELFK